MSRLLSAVKEASLGVRGLRPVAAGFEALGHDPAPIFAGAGLDVGVLADPDARVPAVAVMAMLANAAESLGDSSLGLHLAERADIASFDIHAYAMLSSPTFGALCERLCRYQRLIHDTTRVVLDVETPLARLRHVLPGGLAIPRHSAEFVVASWLRVGRLATGIDWSPVEVCFAHAAPAHRGEIDRFFRAPIRFGAAENALVFPAALLDAPCVGADPGLLAVLDRHAEDLLGRVPPRRSLADRVRVALAAELRGGVPRAAAVARQLHMSVRTLHRGLAAEGATFSDVLDQMRRELALRHLGESYLAIGEVAFVLGYSELSSFYRAFKRWTGMAPAAYREQAHCPRPS
jgi:AraC-like DNA-binding protein